MKKKMFISKGGQLMRIHKAEASRCAFCDSDKKIKWSLLRWDRYAQKLLWCGFLCSLSKCQSLARSFDKIRVDISILEKKINLKGLRILNPSQNIEKLTCRYCHEPAAVKELVIPAEQPQVELIAAVLGCCKSCLKYLDGRAYDTLYLKGVVKNV